MTNAGEPCSCRSCSQLPGRAGRTCLRSASAPQSDAADLEGQALQRAIGVVYRPQTERLSHYFHAAAGEQFDAVIHIDETRALEPLEAWARDEMDLPETYPSGV